VADADDVESQSVGRDAKMGFLSEITSRAVFTWFNARQAVLGQRWISSDPLRIARIAGAFSLKLPSKLYCGTENGTHLASESLRGGGGGLIR